MIMYCPKYSIEDQLEIYMNQYENEAYQLIEKHVNKNIVITLSKFICDFQLEDGAIKLMEIMNVKDIHLAAIERDSDKFDELFLKEFEE